MRPTTPFPFNAGFALVRSIIWIAAACSLQSAAAAESSQRSANTTCVAANRPPPPATPANWGGGWGFFGASTTGTNLPRVLLIGDSILNGYRGTVTRDLAGKANVDVWLNPIHQASPELHE